MTKRLFLAIGICCLFSLSAQEGRAGEVIIHDGGSLTVATGSTLLMNCYGLTVETGGSFVVDGGTVLKRGKLTLEGGIYSVAGRVEKCWRAFYVIPGPQGKHTVICL